jgi:serine/threonine-protein kinase
MDFWVHALKTGVRTKLTFDVAVDVLPVWSRDGREVLFRSNRSGVSNLYRKRLDGSPGDETLVLASTARKDPTDWSPDGTTVLFTQFTGAGGTDVWRLRLDGPSQPEPVSAGPGNQSHARFSPDGRYLAYSSTESGVADILVESLADRRRWRAARGSEPQWSHDGKTLFVVGPGGEIKRIAVGRTADALTFGAADTLFTLICSETSEMRWRRALMAGGSS